MNACSEMEWTTQEKFRDAIGNYPGWREAVGYGDDLG